MMYSIKGRLIQVRENSAVIEDRSGISWELEISARTAQTLGKTIEPEGEVSLFTHLHHREDAMNLYGFIDLDERRFFSLLIKVNGVGPKQSIKLLSAASPGDLSGAIIAEDESFLTSLPGIGAKGAKKLILTLKDEVGKSFEAEYAGMPDHRKSIEPESDSLVDALVQMGFDRKDSQAAVSRLRKEGAAEQPGEGELLRRAIVALS